jgi:hypothetical protein
MGKFGRGSNIKSTAKSILKRQRERETKLKEAGICY